MNLECCEPNVGGWPWQTLSAIHAVVTVWEAADIFSFGQINNARFRWFPIGNISRNLNTTTSIGDAMKNFGTEFCKFYRKGSHNFPHRRLSRRRVITVVICVYVYPQDISKSDAVIGSPNLTYKFPCTMSPENPFILGSKCQRSRSRVAKNSASVSLWTLVSAGFF